MNRVLFRYRMSSCYVLIGVALGMISTAYAGLGTRCNLTDTSNYSCPGTFTTDDLFYTGCPMGVKTCNVTTPGPLKSCIVSATGTCARIPNCAGKCAGYPDSPCTGPVTGDGPNKNGPC
jgi:hypothetical protein